jgi:transcriptional regulator with XRE-family HTH domain
MKGRPGHATLILMNAGITLTELAADLGVTKQAISYQLSGRAAAVNPNLRALIRLRTDQKTYDRIMEAVGDRT